MSNGLEMRIINTNDFKKLFQQNLRLLRVERVESGNFAIKDLLLWQVVMENKLILSGANIFAGLQAKLLANGKPKLFLPGNEILFNAVNGNKRQSVSQCEWENGRGRKKVATLTFRRRRQGQAQRLVQRPVEPVFRQDNSPLCCSARTSCFQDQTPVGKETQCKVSNELRKKANI